MLRVIFLVELALFAQPDAKVANGIYWTNFWLGIIGRLVGSLS